jgi:uroporphyrinogen-III synthase
VPPDQLPTAPLADADMVFFCSPTAVRAFVAAWKERPDCVAIGATTAAVAREAGFRTEVAATPDLDAMLRAAGLGQ